MSTQRAIAQQLRDQAARLEAESDPIKFPVEEGISLENASKRLKQTLPSGSLFSVRCEVTSHGDRPIIVEWEIYDGSQQDGRQGFSRAPTLASALTIALAKHTPAPANPLAEAEAVLQQALAPVPF